jgi:hypothetical protein
MIQGQSPRLTAIVKREEIYLRNEIYLPEISSWLKRPGEMPSRNQVSRSIRQKINNHYRTFSKG